MNMNNASMIRPAVFQDGKLVCSRNAGMSALINPEWKRDIQINKVYKKDGWLCVKTGDVVNRIKIEDAKEILKAIME